MDETTMSEIVILLLSIGMVLTASHLLTLVDEWYWRPAIDHQVCGRRLQRFKPAGGREAPNSCSGNFSHLELFG